MRRPVLIAGVVVALVVGLALVLRRPRPKAAPSVSVEATDPAAGAPGAAGSAGAPGPAPASPGRGSALQGRAESPTAVPAAQVLTPAERPAPPDTAPRDPMLEGAVRERVDTVIAALSPGAAVLKTLVCVSGRCELEVEVVDDGAFRKAYARLMEPGGLADLGERLVLESPRSLGDPDLGPFLYPLVLEGAKVGP